MRVAKALASVCICAYLPEPLLFSDAITTRISCTDLMHDKGH